MLSTEPTGTIPRWGNTRLHELWAKFRATFERSSCFLSKRAAGSLVAMFLVLCSATFSIFNGILRDICVGSSSSAIYLADPSTSNRGRRETWRSRGTLDRLNLSIPIPLKVGSVSSRNFSNFSFHGDLSDKISRWKSPLEEISSFPATVDLNVSKPCFNRGTATRIGPRHLLSKLCFTGDSFVILYL